jgi:FMN phosphatase YigB (HAD superfamily)
MTDAAADGLPSWNDTATRQAIGEFVATASRTVPPEERVAVFDNDGTLWCEKPMPIQLDFTVRRLAELARADATLAEAQPYKAAVEGDLNWLGAAMVKHYHGDDADLALLEKAVASAFVDVSVEDFAAQVTAFFADAAHPTLARSYRACGYVPMVELLRYLESSGFVTYIASGGDRDFMRAVAGDLYGIPPERVIGSSLKLDYAERDASVLYKAGMEFFDDGPTKPVRIWSRTGRRPIVAFGNSNGDEPMLAFAGGSRPALRLLLLHDDEEREAAYTAGAETVLERARGDGWTVVSMKDDWSTVFADAT